MRNELNSNLYSPIASAASNLTIGCKSALSPQPGKIGSITYAPKVRQIIATTNEGLSTNTAVHEKRNAGSGPNASSR